MFIFYTLNELPLHMICSHSSVIPSPSSLISKPINIFIGDLTIYAFDYEKFIINWEFKITNCLVDSGMVLLFQLFIGL